MLPALALSLAARAAIEARRDALLSFDAEKGRKVFPGLKTTPVADLRWQGWVRPVIAQAFARYPTFGLISHLEGVYVVWDLSYEGTSMGATNDGSRRVVVGVGTTGVDAVWLERVVHHEFAHALKDHRGSHFPLAEWRRANAPSFRYGTGGFDALKAGRMSETFDPAMAAQGVLSEYSASSIDEDWATFAEAIMVDDSVFWANVARYPRLKEKARLAEAFYRRTFPGIRLREIGQ